MNNPSRTLRDERYSTRSHSTGQGLNTNNNHHAGGGHVRANGLNGTHHELARVMRRSQRSRRTVRLRISEGTMEGLLNGCNSSSSSSNSTTTTSTNESHAEVNFNAATAVSDSPINPAATTTDGGGNTVSISALTAARGVNCDDGSADDECAICKDAKTNRSFLVPCMHTYCFNCILRWVKINPTCPLCKTRGRRIIHSIISDMDYREYVIHSTPNLLPGPAAVLNLESILSNDHFTHVHRWHIGSSRMSRGSDISSLLHPGRAFTTPRRLASESRSQLLVYLLVTVLNQQHLPHSIHRRLLYHGRYRSYPTQPAAGSDAGSSPVSESELASFLLREMHYCMPWTSFTRRHGPLPSEESPWLLGGMDNQPLVGQMHNNFMRGSWSDVARNLAQRLLQHAATRSPYDVTSSLKNAARSLVDEGYVRRGAALTLIDEGIQFLRYRGSPEEYYANSAILSRFYSYPSDLPMERTSAIYYPGEGVVEHRAEVVKGLWDWLHRQFYRVQANTSCYEDIMESLRTRTALDEATREVREFNTVFADPRVILRLNHPDSPQTPPYELISNGVDALLVSVCHLEHSVEELTALVCELMDMALVIESNYGVPDIMPRLVCLIEYYKSLGTRSPPPQPTTIDLREPTPPRLSSTTAPITISTAPAAATEIREPEELILVDDEDDDDDVDGGDGENEGQRCCEVHRHHCCCCERRRLGNSRGGSYRSLFLEFLDFMEARKRRKRRRVEINSRSSPIVISDGESDANADGIVCLDARNIDIGDDEGQPRPGPSRQQQPRNSSSDSVDPGVEIFPPDTVEDATMPETMSSAAEENGNTASTVIERPQTASEFYSLLSSAFAANHHEAAAEETREEEAGEPEKTATTSGSSCSSQGSNSSQLASVQWKVGVYEEGEHEDTKPPLLTLERPLSAPAPLHYTNDSQPHV